MLALAANWSGDTRAIDDANSPGIARYLDEWGRDGDLGLIATDQTDRSERIGAAWWRHFSADGPGYGFISESIPEVSIAVSPTRSGAGVGRALLVELIARAERDLIPALSLSVHRDNPAASLYRDIGFGPVGAGGRSESLTMRRVTSAPRHGGTWS